MTSPFPGMDPYIESSDHWGDFHTSFIVALRAELNGQLPENFVADIDLYVWSREPQEGETSLLEPDVYVREAIRRVPGKPRRSLPKVAQMTVTFPRKVRRRQRYLRIVDRDRNRVVTAIEVLSPSNKRTGPDREKYLAKREEYLAGNVSLVEIDLLRGGRRLPLGNPAPQARDYYVLVFRSWVFPRAQLLTFSMRDPLPEIPIPLDADVPEIHLPLRPSMDRAYEDGRYASSLRYQRPLVPRPRGEDASWVRDLLATRTSA